MPGQGLHRLPLLLVGTQLVPPPRPRRSEAFSWDRLLSIAADGFLEGTHQIPALYSAR